MGVGGVWTKPAHNHKLNCDLGHQTFFLGHVYNVFQFSQYSYIYVWIYRVSYIWPLVVTGTQLKWPLTLTDHCIFSYIWNSQIRNLLYCTELSVENSPVKTYRIERFSCLLCKASILQSFALVDSKRVIWWRLHASEALALQGYVSPSFPFHCPMRKVIHLATGELMRITEQKCMNAGQLPGLFSSMDYCLGQGLFFIQSHSKLPFCRKGQLCNTAVNSTHTFL